MFYLRMYPAVSQTGQLFLAILPDVDASAEIYRKAMILKRANGFQGALTPRDRLHVTLFSLTGLPQSASERVSEAIEEARAGPFDVSFDLTMSFKGRPGSRPFVLTGGAGLDPLKSFRRRLAASMKSKALGFPGRREFTPHVTLLFDERAAEENPIGPIVWTARHVVLIHSLRGHVHLAQWPLQI
jgi:RNA 2',3'-cyclic 3'-phosphodiesterase